MWRMRDKNAGYADAMDVEKKRAPACAGALLSFFRYSLHRSFNAIDLGFKTWEPAFTHGFGGNVI